MYGDLYRESRERISKLVSGLSDEQLTLPNEACPGWTVHDTLRHLAGESRCFATGDLEGAPSPEWTAKQVADRNDRTVTELVAEWAEHSPSVEALPDDNPWWLPIAHDVLCHETDIAAAVGAPVAPLDAVKAAMPLIERRLPKRFGDLGSVELVLDGQSTVIGDGDPALRVDTSLFEFWRGHFGRRSPAQMQSWVTSGDAVAFAEKLPVFPARQTDLIE
jgi:uncharacterized protein (TIGR03083 family)